ncbi:class D sortase [Acidimicrobium ferrooxidans]|nr:class D sortase [Acidimicrobium ferrooxidans]
MLAGLGLIGSIVAFYVRSSLVGGGLIQQAQKARTVAAWPRSLLAIVRIPSIGLVAPVEQGTGQSVLAVAVGHLTTSALPGKPGTSVLAAHNVSWFSGLGGLGSGSLIEVDTPYGQQVYRVAWHRVVHVGAPVANTAAPTLVLEACWPLNALYLTPERYLVGATLVATTKIAVTPVTPSSDSYQPLGLAPTLAHENLSLAANDLPMGVLATVGSPAAAWTSSQRPYNFAGAEVTWTIALLHALEAHDLVLVESVTHEPASVVAPLLSWDGGFASLDDLTEVVDGVTASAGSSRVSLQTDHGPLVVTLRFRVIGHGVEVAGAAVGTSQGS